ncbi:cysteine desulfurase [Methanotrichaceae archaeon M04Ac]|jgi:cysteine desulfurase/selenocysteine lyase|uniref:cysteine desulfurase n=1 Tax=Candidatus Methanocrinis alkalitolerans TaxID=3033395 RepID=A0ABT5XEF9_9EURY|nr:cysteine desulfurase [Candidatus Methanocrinis alkalitolerans]MDF0593101.1 cysteine desulfurase [Candidatus Methanocrinis alkalitolerans]
MNPEEIRRDFPLLKDVIYMDSASTSLTPEPVLASILEYYRGYRANVGRGVYRLSRLADDLYRNAHRNVADFIGAEEGVVFTRNTTEAINAVAEGLKWRRGDVVVTTAAEHHSNLLPWMRLRDMGVGLKIVKPDPDGSFDPASFEAAIDGDTMLVAMTIASNVLGTALPAREVSEICRERGAPLLLDGAQSVPHLPTNVGDLGCDYLCFSGHKMLGPSGTGALWMREYDLLPLLVGGGAVEEVDLEGYTLKGGYEGYEAGSPDVAGGIGLAAAVDYLRHAGMEEIALHEGRLTRRLLAGLLDIEGVEVYGSVDSRERVGIISFNVAGVSPTEVAHLLDEGSDIMVRSGHHCCMPLMRHLGLPAGTVRASLYLYNTSEEVEELLAAVEEISKMA